MTFFCHLPVHRSELVQKFWEDDVGNDQTSAENDVPGGNYLQQQPGHDEQVVE